MLNIKHLVKRLVACKPLLSSKSIFTKQHKTMSGIVPATRMENQMPSVWVEFIQLALQHNPVNLGQGFPDYAAPEHVTNALAEATSGPNKVRLNQYTRGFGHPRLVAAISKLYETILQRKINEQTEVLVTIGAYEALFCAIMAYVNPGDEVIIIEPFFDCYAPITLLAGGVPVYIPLRPTGENVTSSKDWVLDPKELESKFTAKTKMIIVNTPNNPLGKVFTRQELEVIGQLCQKHNVIALMDEVYEWLIYPDNTHVRMASLPGMWDYTLTVGSGGKTFSVTGWKLGWVYGSSKLLRPLQMFHQNCVYTCPTPIQEAAAVGFETELARINEPDCYWKTLVTDLVEKRNKLADVLAESNMRAIIPEGGYFMLADYTSLNPKLPEPVKTKDGQPLDYKFVKWLTIEKKLQGIPPSAFYSDEHKHLAEKYIRFCFFKEESTLEAAGSILKKL